MFGIYAEKMDQEDPLSGLKVGEMPEPQIPEGWLRVKISHASLNRHDIFTLQGLNGQTEPIKYPMILGNDGAGTLDDGTEVGIYSVMGSADWHGDEMLDPKWHVFSELVPGTMAQYVAVPKRNAVPIPTGLSREHAASLGTVWLVAYRALFRKSNLKSGQTMLVQGAAGGMSTALIQLGRAAGYEVWATARNEAAREVGEHAGAHRVLNVNENLPEQVRAVFDNVGPATWGHTMSSVAHGGTVVSLGITTGPDVKMALLPIFVNELTIVGAVMGTREDFLQLMKFVQVAGIEPEIGRLLPMQQAEEGFREMWYGTIRGKTVFTL
ncbi:MAG TPA: zinc-binding dehydrogenase [Geobacteraceae bacterium]|nr:zinc-binding dehydrogenase [Geobacteraceae bacterium]